LVPGRLSRIAEVLGIPVRVFFETTASTTLKDEDRKTSPLDMLAEPGAARVLRAFTQLPKGPLLGRVSICWKKSPDASNRMTPRYPADQQHLGEIRIAPIFNRSSNPIQLAGVNKGGFSSRHFGTNGWSPIKARSPIFIRPPLSDQSLLLLGSGIFTVINLMDALRRSIETDTPKKPAEGQAKARRSMARWKQA
jgi:hypothetical protein